MSAILHISAAIDPQSLPRILGLFSQRWLVPDAITVTRTGTSLKIACLTPPMAAEDIALIAAKMREMILIRSVRVSKAKPINHKLPRQRSLNRGGSSGHRAARSG